MTAQFKTFSITLQSSAGKYNFPEQMNNSNPTVFKVHLTSSGSGTFFGCLFDPLILRFLTFLTFRRERYRDIYVEFAKFLVKRLRHDVVC